MVSVHYTFTSIPSPILVVGANGLGKRHVMKPASTLALKLLADSAATVPAGAAAIRHCYCTTEVIVLHVIFLNSYYLSFVGSLFVR